MNRRQYLARASAAGSSVGVLTGLAGCLDDLSGASGSDEADADEGTGSRAGVRALDRAAGKLNEAAQTLDELEGLENPADVEFDPEPPRTAIDEARDHLETAESELGDDRQADIETLRSYADALEGLVAVTATVTDDAIGDDIDAVTAALESEGDIEGASATVDERYSSIADAHERWDEANTTVRDLDSDRLGDLTGVDPADLEDGVAALGDAVSSLETLAAAYDATLDLEDGYGALERGREHSDDREYEAARTEFETAEATFSDARERLENGTADAPEGLVDYFETGECHNRHLAAAATEFAAAAEAASNGNLAAADDHRSEGEAEIEAVGDCS